MKYLVETLGDYGLHDLFAGQQIAASRPSVVVPSAFVEGQRGRKLKVLKELDDSADDATLAVCKDKDELTKAIAALPLEGAEPAKVEEAKPVAKPRSTASSRKK